MTAATIHSDFTKEDWEITAEALDEWMRRHAPEALLMQTISGYQWKRLFLPEGTLLRTVFGGKNYNCLIEGDRILYKDQAVSPSGFVNAVGGIRRNAWRCIWILFPNTTDWKLADTLRTRERPHRARARKPVQDIGQMAQPGAAGAPDSLPPVGVSPVSAPSTLESESLATSASKAPCLPQASQDPIQQPGSTGEHNDSHPRAAIPRDERMAALLREELLPLLYRLFAFIAMPVAGRTAPV